MVTGTGGVIEVGSESFAVQHVAPAVVGVFEPERGHFQFAFVQFQRQPLLRVEGLARRGEFQGVSFSVRPGEVLRFERVVVTPGGKGLNVARAARYPEASIIFDNLHSMHDVISDILANPAVPRDRKRAEILLAARRFRDDTSFVTTEQGWRTMAQHMGLENMGGPPVGFLPELPTPTVTYGAVMTHDPATGEMTGFTYGSAVGDAHAAHGGQAPAAAADTGAHAGHGAPAAPARADTGAHAGHGAMAGAMPMPHDSGMALHMRMMQDPVIRQRMMADSAMHRMMMQMMQQMMQGHGSSGGTPATQGGVPGPAASGHAVVDGVSEPLSACSINKRFT